MELDLGRYTLVHAGRTVRLEKQPMELLILLAEKRGQLVTRDEIVARLWTKDVFLDTERSINTAIRKIRAAVNDHPDRPRVIETVVGKGYRFIAPITVIPAKQPPRGSDLQPPLDRPWRSRAVLASASLVLATVLGSIVGWNWLRPSPAPRPIRSLAVLPLQNVSGDPTEDYFADAMTQALTTDIARVSGLRVISHTTALHYRQSGKTLPEIAAELRIDAIVEGSVTRREGRVRVTAQLVEATTDRHVWAETYERSTSDLLSLQDEVARAIARQIKSRLSAQSGGLRLHSQDPEAQDSYLKGLHEADTFTREGLEQSIGHFEEAVQRAPGFAEAWAGLSRDYSLVSLFHYAPRADATAKATAAAKKAVELDDHLSEAHAALGGVLLKQWSFAAAEKELLRSIELEPSNSGAHLSLGYLYAGVLGRFEEGIEEMNRALDLDPLSPSKRNALGAALYWARRYDDALRVFAAVPDGDANTERRHRRMAEIYERKGMQRESIEELVRAMQRSGRPSLAEAVQRTYRSDGYLAARKVFLAGDVRERLSRAGREEGSGDELWLAADYAMLSDHDQAFHWLDKAFAGRDEALMYLPVEGHFENLRSDPRFATLAHQVGLH